MIEGEVFVDDIACGEQAVPAHVAFIVEVFFVVAQYTAFLFRRKIYTEQCPGGHADNAVNVNLLIQEDIQHAGGEHPAHGAAFQYQSDFHQLNA